jgi:hypothetical protein
MGTTLDVPQSVFCFLVLVFEDPAVVLASRRPSASAVTATFGVVAMG